MDFETYQDSCDDRRDYCEDCVQPMALCRCVVDPVALAVQNLERAIEDFDTAIADAATTDEAMRLSKLIGELETRLCEVTLRALQRADDLGRAA